MIDRHLEEIAAISGFRPDWLRKTVTCLDINNIADWVHNKIKLEQKIEIMQMLMPPWPILWCEFAGNNNPFWKHLDNAGILTIVNDNKLINILFGELLKRRTIVDMTTISYDIINNKISNKFNVAPAHTNYKNRIEFDLDIHNLTGLFIPLIFAITFTHCKNIIINKIEISNKLQKARHKRGKQPFIRFNTIIIDPMREIIRKEAAGEKIGIKRALHICRGHFVTYSADAPMFGRIAGTFWKPIHIRGNKKEGIVIKDYEIKPPSNLGLI